MLRLADGSYIPETEDSGDVRAARESKRRKRAPTEEPSSQVVVSGEVPPPPEKRRHVAVASQEELRARVGSTRDEQRVPEDREAGEKEAERGRGYGVCEDEDEFTESDNEMGGASEKERQDAAVPVTSYLETRRRAFPRGSASNPIELD